MYCSQCGTELEPGAVYCAACGHKVSGKEGQEKSSVEVAHDGGKKKKTKGRSLLLFFLIVALATLTFGIINIVELYDYYLFRVEDHALGLQITDDHASVPSNEEGLVQQGSLQLPGGVVVYDTFYDDDTTQDGTRDRRSYYLKDELVFASWDEDLDGQHDLLMSVSEGLYIEAEYADVDRDGFIDEVTTFDRQGEVIGFEIQEEGEGQARDGSLAFTDVLKTQDILLLVLPTLATLVLLIFLWRSRRNKQLEKRLLSLVLVTSLLGMSFSSSVYAFDLYNEDGTINQQVFDLEWMKYSDIDDRIPAESRSYPAQQVKKTQERLVQIQEEMVQVMAEKELLRLEYTTFAATKEAVSRAQQENLIKTLIRLSVLTYRVGSTAASVTKHMAKFGSKAVDIANHVVETVDPVNLSLMVAVPSAAVGTAILEEDVKETVSSVVEASVERVQKTIVTNSYIKLSEEEIDILRQGYLKNREADNDLLENRKAYRKKRDRQRTLASEVEELLEEQSLYVAQEKERVFALLTERAPTPEEEEPPTLEDDADEEGTFDFLDETPVIDFEPMEESESPSAKEVLVGQWKGTSILEEAELLNSDQFVQKDLDDFNRTFPVGTQGEEHWVIEESAVEGHYLFTVTDGTTFTVELLGDRLVYSSGQEQAGRSLVTREIDGYIDPVNETIEMTEHLHITLYNPNEGRPDFLIELLSSIQMVKD